jgi:hypothetical protein
MVGFAFMLERLRLQEVLSQMAKAEQSPMARAMVGTQN